MRQTRIYDAAGRLTEEHAYNPNAVRVAENDYDEVGNLISRWENSRNYITLYEYDDLNRRTKFIKTSAKYRTEQVTIYDRLGRVISLTDEAGDATHFEYDPVGRLMKVR